jgi:hypothetical protein
LLIFVSFAFLCWTSPNLVQVQYVVNTGGKIFNFQLNLVFLQWCYHHQTNWNHALNKMQALEDDNFLKLTTTNADKGI